jgi:hypothetical protein
VSGNRRTGALSEGDHGAPRTELSRAGHSGLAAPSESAPSENRWTSTFDISGGDPVEVHPAQSLAERQSVLNGPSGSPTSPPGRDLQIFLWGWNPLRWRCYYVHRLKYGGFRELLIGPVSFVWRPRR